MLNNKTMNTNKNLPDRISIEGDAKFNFDVLRKGNFVYEGYGRNRFLRYTGPEKTYAEVRNTPKKGDIITHNIDLIKNKIYIENEKSQDALYTYQNEEDALTAFLYIVGNKNLVHIKNSK